MSERKKRGIDADVITAALAAPFDLDEIKFKPQVVKGNRAMALAYIDARVIQDRLDEVLGVEGWQDAYTVIEGGSVICKLRIKIGYEWITKMDVGSPSEQPDGGDRTKAAFSDALKRAAVKFGIGRYLYRLPQIWCDYDSQKKQFVRTPALPGSANVPGPKLAEPPKPTRSPAKGALPADCRELVQRLHDYDEKLAKQGVWEKGALIQHITQEGITAGYESNLTSWAGPAIEFAVEATRKFEASQRRRAAA
jgi:hypothetical protein